MRKYLRSGALVALALTFALGLVPGSAFAALAGVTVGATTAVSVPKVQSYGTYNEAFGGSMSDDGRYVVYASYTNDTAVGDINGYADVFRYDRTTKITEIVSRNNDGVQSNGDSQQPYISGNGRYVVFRSSGSNMNTDGGDYAWHIYVRDMVDGTTTLVDRADGATGAAANNEPAWPTISDDGSKVAFESDANNLVSSEADGAWDRDVFVRDLSSNTTTLAAIGATGVVSPHGSFQASISGNGNFVVFYSDDSALVSGPTYDLHRLYRKNLSTGEILLVSRDADGAIDNYINNSSRVGISDDGRYVAWTSNGALSATTDTNDTTDVYWRDIQTGTVKLISVNSDGDGAGNNTSHWPLISGDGQSVLFYSAASNLTASDSELTDMFVRNVTSNKTVRVSVGTDGVAPNQNVPEPTWQIPAYYGISDNGALAAFESFATNLLGSVKGTGHGSIMVAQTTGTTTGVIESAVHTYDGWTADAQQPVLSGNLRYVVFRADAQLTADDTNNRQDVYRFDRNTGDLELVSKHLTSDTDDDADSGEDDCAISADGRYIVFPSESPDLIEGDTNGKKDIFLRDMVAGTTIRMNEGKAADGSWWQPTWEASHVSMTPDARYIAFQTPSKLESPTVAAWPPFNSNRGYAQTYVIDRQGDNIRSNDTIRLVSQGEGGWITAEQNSPEGVNKPQISADGKWILLSSKAKLDQAEYGTTSNPNVYLRSLESTDVIRVSASYDGGYPEAEANQAVVSADGKFVAFHVDDTANIVENDTNGENDVFLWSRETLKTIRITHAEDGTEANNESSHPSISADGRYVMYHSWATNLDATGEVDLGRYGDTKEIYLYDVAADKSMLVDGIDGWSQQVSFVANADGTAGVAYAGAPTRTSDCEGAWVTTLSVPPTSAPAPTAVLKKIGGNKFLGNSTKLTLLAQSDLRKVARTIKAKGYKSVAVRGYTSRFGDGSSSARLKLSTVRAQAAKSYLTAQLKKLGVSGVKIAAKGYGANNPVATNLTFKGRQQNRRVEVWAK